MMNSSEQQIANKKSLPQICRIQRKLLLPVESVAIKTGPKSTADVALVCLRDASEVGCEVEYALHQVLQHYDDLRLSPQANVEEICRQRCKFYLDDVALRLYGAAEHTASFIVFFLNIDEGSLRPYQDRHVSLAVAVGKYMVNMRPDHEITQALSSLLGEENWLKAICYRNTWVHQQPPLLNGLGIVYNREPRWKKTTQGHYRMGIGLGDKPEYTIDSLLEMIWFASHAFANLLETLSDILIDFLKDLHIRMDDAGNVQVNL